VITELRTAVYAVIALALFVLALALFAPMSAGAQAPQARCQPGALLGHAPRSMTGEYTHITLAALQPYVDRWAQLVLGESGGKIARIGA